MTNEDRLSTLYSIDIQHQNSLLKDTKTDEDNASHETMAWKVRVLHAIQLERMELQNKVSTIETNIQTLFNEMMN